MEVVSPLTFGRANQGAKRRFGSPIHHDAAIATNTDDTMDDSDYGFQAAKRRKRFPTEGGTAAGGLGGGFQSKENWSLSPFVHQASSRSPAHAAGGAGEC